MADVGILLLLSCVLDHRPFDVLGALFCVSRYIKSSSVHCRFVLRCVLQESDPEYPKFAPLLSDGWIPGRKVVSQSHVKLVSVD